MSPFETLRTKTTHAAEDSKEAGKIESTHYHAPNKKAGGNCECLRLFGVQACLRALALFVRFVPVSCPSWLEVDRHVETHEARIEDLRGIQELRAVAVVLLERRPR